MKRRVKPKDIADPPGRTRRTIEREIKRGLVVLKDIQWRDKEVYQADAAQRASEQNASNKGRTLKIGCAHDLVKHIKENIKDYKYSPDVVIGEIKRKGVLFGSEICIKTLYNYIDRGLFLKISNKDFPIKVLDKPERKYRKEFFVKLKSITMDNGSEFLNIEGIEKAVTRKGTRTTFYYVHLYGAYERGLNEEENKLIRRFGPKGSSIDKLAVAAVKRIENWMNDYPGRIFNYKSANEMAA